MSVENVIAFFCENKGIKTLDIFDYNKKDIASITRYMIWHFLHTRCKWSGNKLSQYFKRNTPSIFRGIRELKNRMQYDKELRNEYGELAEKLERMPDKTSSH